MHLDPQGDLRAQYIKAMRAYTKGKARADAWGLCWIDPRYPAMPDLAPFVDRRCGAKGKRTGKPCPLTSIYANSRCKWHGGESTGPKTPEGKARASRNGLARKARQTSDGVQLVVLPSPHVAYELIQPVEDSDSDTKVPTDAIATGQDVVSSVRPRRMVEMLASDGRSCSTCCNFSAGHTCMVSARSGIAFPNPNVTRRCQAFKADRDADDSRTGVELWPE